MNIEQIYQILVPAQRGTYYSARTVAYILGYGWSQFQEQVIRKALLAYDIADQASQDEFVFLDQECRLSPMACLVVLLCADSPWTLEGIHATLSLRCVLAQAGAQPCEGD